MTSGGMPKLSRLTMKDARSSFTFRDGMGDMMSGSRWILHDYSLFTGGQGSENQEEKDLVKS